MTHAERAEAHAALGDVKRLMIVEQLAKGDWTVTELAEISAMSGNLLAHHLDVLEAAGLIQRRMSEGDRRRRYVSLRREGLPFRIVSAPVTTPDVVFVCTHNSARSQFAAALWEKTTGSRATSAGSDPAPRVHPKAVQVADEFGIDLRAAEPGGYDRVQFFPALVVSVCDRAREHGVPAARESLHWSVPDPVAKGTLAAFRSAFDEISRRVDHFVGLERVPSS